MDYHLREIDPAFWAKVKERAADDHRTVRSIIFMLLTAWLKGQVKL